jgi:protein gp37
VSNLSSIEWCDATWNPTRGCSRVSEGCRHCFAERIAARFSRSIDEIPGPRVGQTHDAFHGFAHRVGGEARWTGKVELIESALDWPLRWRGDKAARAEGRPSRIFVNSMSDLFHESLSDEGIERVFARMALAQQHVFQILTKRPERMQRWFSSGVPGLETRAEDVARAAEHAGRIVYDGRGSDRHKYPPASGDVSNRRVWPGWPLPNVWLGVSVEDQAAADARIPLLLQTPAAIRFVSYEPALGPVDFAKFMWPVHGWWIWPHHSYAEAKAAGSECGLRRQALVSAHARFVDWVIVGGESGPGARPFDVAWARATVEQCKAAGCAVFVKQLGANVRELHNTGRLADSKGGDPAEWPDDIRVREFPR